MSATNEAARSAPADDRVEAAAQMLHARRHRAGYGHCCDRCRADVRAIAPILNGGPSNG